MTEILVGYPGQELKSFHLNDILRGAVRDSGFFPELYKTDLPPMLSGALISGVERKLGEHGLSFEPYDFPIFLPPSLMPKAMEDYKEDDDNQVGIVQNKVARGFSSPVMSHAARLTPEEREAFFKKIATRASTDDARKIITFGDDRGLRLDPKLKMPLYGHLVDHYSPQVTEIFASDHLTPGKRIKEVDGANMGVINSVAHFHSVCGALRSSGEQFDSRNYMDTTLVFTPLLAGLLPLSEQGLIIKAVGNPNTFREVHVEDFDKIHKGRILTYDHFVHPEGEGFPNWVTLQALKRVVANDQTSREKKTFRGVDPVQADDYLRYRHSPGAASTAFAAIIGLPKRGEEPPAKLRPSYLAASNPEIILTSGSFLGISKKGLTTALPLKNGYRLSRTKKDLHFSLRDLEIACHKAQAFAVVHPDKYPITDEHMSGVREKEHLKLLRQLATSVVGSYLVTMSTMAGAAQHIGRPHLVDKDWLREFAMYHPDLCNLGLTGDSETEAYRLFSSPDDIKEALASFDPKTYNHALDTPENEFLSESQVQEMIGQQLGYCVIVYGSSGGFADATYRHARALTNALAKRNNISIATGAGTQSGMGGMNDGAIEAMQEGFKTLLIGARSDTDVSPLEGDHGEYFSKLGVELQQNPNEARHEYSDDQMVHIIHSNRILARQALMAEIMHAAVILDGGKGTALEFFITAYHNAKLNLTGQGFLGHNRIVPLVVSNRTIDFCGTKRGVFDELLEPWRHKGHLIGLRECQGENPIPDIIGFLQDHASGRKRIYGQEEAYAFDVSPQQIQLPSTQTLPLFAHRTRQP